MDPQQNSSNGVPPASNVPEPVVSGEALTGGVISPTATPPPEPVSETPPSPDLPAPEVSSEPAPLSAMPEATTPVSEPTPPQDQPVSPVAVTSPEVSPVQDATPAPFVSEPTAPATITTGHNGSAPGSKKRLIKPLAIIGLAVLILGGGSAAAYFGVVVPNKPENVLKTAITNSLQSPQKSAKATVASASGAPVAYKVDILGAQDAVKKTAEFSINATISGANLTLDARYVDQNLYIKVGDLSTVTALLGGIDPSLQTIGDSVNKTLGNQWIEIDSTLIKQAGLDCYLNDSWNVSSSDLNALEQAYAKQSFVSITSTSSDTENGKAATKYVLSVSDDKLASYGNNLKNLSVLKTLNACSKSTTNLPIPAGDHKSFPLTVWVDKSSKKISQIGVTSKTTGSVDANATIQLSYANVNIAAPTGAKPALAVLTELQTDLTGSGLDLTNLLGNFTGVSSSSSITGGMQDTAKDSKRKVDVLAVYSNLEAYFATNNHYPSLKDMNSATWIKANMKGLDPSALQDPDGSSTQLAAKPAKNVMSYQPTTKSGASCEANDTTCTKYTLTSTLSDGSLDTKLSQQ